MEQRVNVMGISNVLFIDEAAFHLIVSVNRHC